MKNQDFHIGELIKQKLVSEERSNAWLARKLSMDASNVSRLLQHQHLDAELLLRISIILGKDFFAYYSYEYQRRIHGRLQEMQ